MHINRRVTALEQTLSHPVETHGNRSGGDPFMKTARRRSLTPFLVLSILLAAALFGVPQAHASCTTGNVELTATGGDNGPTGYATLGDAFTAINAGTSTGAITLTICADTTESASAVLNASGSGSASYTGITISPAGTRSITGAVAGVLIDLDGAANVVIDGLNSGGNGLTLENTSTASSAATIRFIDDASNDTVQNCTIKGAETGASSGTIVFDVGFDFGNLNDTITANTITASGAGNPVNAIYSAGSPGIPNTASITNNNISDWFSPTLASNGIFLKSNSAAWVITGNKLFQTASRASTAAVTHRAINIVTAGGGGYTVSNNTIGYGSAAGSGQTIYTSSAATLYRGIEMTVSSSSASSVQGNTVTAIQFSTTASTTSSSSSAGAFAGISVLGGAVNVGTISGNTVGSATATGAITVNSTTTGSVTDGIYATSTGTVAIQNNNVGGITAGNTSAAAIGYVVRGIDTFGTGGNVTISGNTVGSTTVADSIAVGTTSPQTTGTTSLQGIVNAATGSITITNNTIQNCTTNGNVGGLFHGINNSGGTGTLAITGNSVIAGTSRSSTALAQVFGIVTTAAVSTANINNNTLRSMSVFGTALSFQGIQQAGAVTSAININDNRLGDATGGLVTYNGVIPAGSGQSNALFGIVNSAGTSAADMTINHNDFRGVVYAASAAGSGNEHDYINIISPTQVKSQTITNNTFTALNVNTTNTVYLIRVQASLPSTGTATQTITGNAIAGSPTPSFNKAAAGGTVFGINAFTGTGANATQTTSNNNFSNITVTGATAITCILNQDGGSKTVQGNTCDHFTGGTSALTGLSVANGPTNDVISNTVSNFSSSSTQTGITIGVASTSTVHVTSNTVSNLSTSGSVTGMAVGSPSSPPPVTINVFFTSNTVSGLSSTGGSATGIQLGGSIGLGGTLNATASQNVISGLTSSLATAQVVGITGGGAANTASVFRNKVYNLSLTGATTTGTVVGLNAASSSSTFSNNIVGNLTAGSAPTSATSATVIGLQTSSSSLSTTSFYDNTVYITGPSSAFSSTAVQAASGVVLLLRGNVLLNTSNPTGGARAVALWRSNVAPYFYDNASNNNDFYGTSGVYWDGTATYTMGGFWSQVSPRETASISENPPFLEVVNGSSPSFLHVNPSIPTQLESHGVDLGPGVTNDYDGETRQGSPGYTGTGTAPDLGADEFEGAGAGDVTPPAVSYTFLGTGAAASTRTFTATATDLTGVATASGMRPRVYYKKSTDPNDVTGWKYTEAVGSGGSPFTFTMDYSLLNAGSVNPGDTIQYFVVAQDSAPTPNVGIYQGAFAAAPSSVALTSAAFPIGAPVNSYVTAASFAGTNTVCSSGCDYASLTNAGGLFAAINAGVLTGNLTVDILGDSTAETGANALNQWAEDPPAGSGGSFTLTIRPGGGAPRTISGSLTGALIKLNGADRVTIDGLNTGGNALTVKNTSTTSGSAAIHLASLGFQAGATGNTIRNLSIVGGANTAGNYGITIGGASPNTAGADNDSSTIRGNTITRVSYGIHVLGPNLANTPAAGLDDGLNITGNTIGPVAQGSDSLGLAGVLVQFVTAPAISGNTVQNLSTTATSGAAGIVLNNTVIGGSVAGNTITNLTSSANATGTSSIAGIVLTGGTVTGVTVSSNRIQGISNTFGGTGTTGAGARGIIVNSSNTQANITIVNNVVADIVSNPTASNSTWPMGIDLDSFTDTLRVYHNSVNLFGSHSGNNLATGSAALFVNSGPITNADVRDNVFSNSFDNSSSTTDKCYAIYSAGASTTYSLIDNNDYFVGGAGSPILGFIGGADRLDLTAWRTAIGAPKDLASIAVDPQFISTSDLHINQCVSPASPVNNAGVSIASVTVDFDNQARGATPDIGADELTPANVPCNDSNVCTVDSCNPSLGCQFVPGNSGTVCRAAAGSCDVPESCDGVAAACPADQFQPAATPCDDGLGCTTGDHCNGGGSCVTTPVDCGDGSSCTNDTCAEPAGTCSHATNASCDIHGTVRYYREQVGGAEPSLKGIPDENVTRTSSLEASASVPTDAAGSYSFTDEGGNVTLTPASVRVMTDETECHNSITAADATQTAQGAIGIVTLTANQRIAADVSNNGTISSFDAALTAQKAVAAPCLAYAFPVRTATGSDWAFRPVSRTFTPLTGAGEDYSFLGILYGDTTGNWTAPAFAQSMDEKTPAPSLEAAAETALAESTVRIPATALEAGSGSWASAKGKGGATLYLASGPVKNPDGSYTIALGVQQAHGILALDVLLKLDSSVVQVQSVAATGIGSAFSAIGSKADAGYAVALYGVTPLEGTGALFNVTYTTSAPSGMPFRVDAQANEGLIPISWGGPSTTSAPKIHTSE